MPPSPGCFARMRPGAILALTALALLAPTAAEAGCRHLAGEASRAAPFPFPFHFHRLARSGALGAVESSDAPAPAAPRPCSGSLCSRRAANAPMAPKAPPQRIGDPGDLLELIAPKAVGARTIVRAIAEDDLRPVNLGPSIFHPPRLPQPC